MAAKPAVFKASQVSLLDSAGECEVGKAIHHFMTPSLPAKTAGNAELFKIPLLSLPGSTWEHGQGGKFSVSQLHNSSNGYLHCLLFEVSQPPLPVSAVREKGEGEYFFRRETAPADPSAASSGEGSVGAQAHQRSSYLLFPPSPLLYSSLMPLSDSRSVDLSCMCVCVC